MDNVKKVERQVVAGTNYRVNVHLKSSCVIPGGAGEAVIKCRKVRVFVPLPVNCNNPYPGTWLPDGDSQIFRLYVFGPLGLMDYGSATQRCKI